MCGERAHTATGIVQGGRDGPARVAERSGHHVETGVAVREGGRVGVGVGGSVLLRRRGGRRHVVSFVFVFVFVFVFASPSSSALGVRARVEEVGELGGMGEERQRRRSVTVEVAEHLESEVERDDAVRHIAGGQHRSEW